MISRTPAKCLCLEAWETHKNGDKLKFNGVMISRSDRANKTGTHSEAKNLDMKNEITVSFVAELARSAYIANLRRLDATYSSNI